MISNLAAARRRTILILLAASTVLASPVQAKQTSQQPARPAVSDEISQVSHSSETIVAIPVPLPLPGQLQLRAAPARPRVAPLCKTGWERQWKLQGSSLSRPGS